jgi:TolB-like protein/Tfp pilus assembly protein PilF
MVADSTPLADPVAAPPATGGSRRWARRLVVPAVLSLAAVIWLASSSIGRLAGDPSSIRSLVVLPVANLSGDAEQDYLADGITDAIIANLSQIRSLRVISRTSAMTYKNVKKTIPAIARELGVDGVIEGSLQQTGRGLSLTVTLRDAHEHLWWSKTYPREGPDATTVQLAVARDVASRIGVDMTAADIERLAAKPIDPRAYEAYTRGRYFWNRRSGEDLQRAIAQFRSAIAIEPSYAPAYAGLADSYAIIGSYGFAAGKDAFDEARAAAERAVQLDPNLADGHTSRANIAVQDWDWARAEVEYKRALALNPGYATARHWYGYYLLLVGRPRDAEAEITAALQLDPLSPIINANIGFCRYIGRDYEGALAHLGKALEMHPQFRLIHSYMGLVHVARGSYADAVAAFEKAFDAGAAPSDQAVLAHALARGGNITRAKGILTDLQRPAADRFVPAYYLALIHVGLGDTDAAFAALDRAFEERVGPLNELNIDPMFDLLRGDARFARLVARLHLQ